MSTLSDGYELAWRRRLQDALHRAEGKIRRSIKHTLIIEFVKELYAILPLYVPPTEQMRVYVEVGTGVYTTYGTSALVNGKGKSLELGDDELDRLAAWLEKSARATTRRGSRACSAPENYFVITGTCTENDRKRPLGFAAPAHDIGHALEQINSAIKHGWGDFGGTSPYTDLMLYRNGTWTKLRPRELDAQDVRDEKTCVFIPAP